MRLLLAAALMALSSSFAQAGDTAGNVADGKRVASMLCANCHDVAGTTKSPPGGAPPFVTIARTGADAEKLRRFLRLPHGKMTNVLLTEDNTDDVVSYIRGLADGK